MITANVEGLELMSGWGEGDPTMRGRVDFPIYAAHGSEACATVYFEVDRGEHIGRHTDSAEEILYSSMARAKPWSGTAIAGEPRCAGLVPEFVPHDLYATGDTPLRVLGFFAAAMVESVLTRRSSHGQARARDAAGRGDRLARRRRRRRDQRREA